MAAVGHLRFARSQLRDELADVRSTIARLNERRNDVITALNQLDHLINKLGGVALSEAAGSDQVMHLPDGREVAIEVKRHQVNEDGSGSNSIRDGILYVLAAEKGPLGTSEIVEAVQRLGIEAQPASTRSLLSKMAETGQIHRLRRGLYQAHSHWSQPHLSGLEPSEPAGMRKPTVNEFMAMRSEDEDDTSEFSEPDDRSDADYAELARKSEFAHLEDQAEREDSTT